MERHEAHKLAAHKARYTHKAWIAWVDSNGVGHAAAETKDAVKQAMLAVGTAGRWTAYSGTRGYVQRWPLGVLRLRNLKCVNW